MGLNEGTPVFGGCGDIPAISVGSGCCELGDAHVYLGSSGWLASMVSSKEGFLSTSPFDKENNLLMFGYQAIGLAFDWVIRLYYAAEYEAMGPDIYNYIEKECMLIPPGSDGVLATHWMYGERPPFFSDRARGAFVNLNNIHTRAHMVNAMMESVCYTVRMSLDALRTGTRRDVKMIRAVGGCAGSDFWMQMLADVLGITVEVTQSPRHAGAIGTAYCALIGLGIRKDFSEVKSQIQINKRFEPRPETAGSYANALAAYKQLYKALDGVCHILK
jgi:xylulokinase